MEFAVCDCIGLVAVRSDDVLEVMSEDFPEKYVQYESKKNWTEVT